MRETWNAVKVPVLGVVAIMALALLALWLTDSPLLTNTKEPWSLTGNVVVDDLLYDGKITADAPCAPLDDPVCGIDAKTYRNFCEARKAGVKAFQRGACDPWFEE